MFYFYSPWERRQEQRQKKTRWRTISSWFIWAGLGYMVLGAPFLRCPEPYNWYAAALFFSGLAELVFGEAIYLFTERR